MTILPENTNELVASGDLQTLWNLFKLIVDENEELNKAYLSVKYGLKTKFNINYALKNKFTEKAKQDTILINKVWIPLQQYWDELDDRSKLMRQIILEYAQEEEPVKPRT